MGLLRIDSFHPLLWCNCPQVDENGHASCLKSQTWPTHVAKNHQRICVTSEDTRFSFPCLPFCSGTVSQQMEYVRKKMVFHALCFLKLHTEPESKKKKEQAYRDLYNGWSKSVHQLGRLGTNHVITAAAVIGVVPFWIVNKYYKAQKANPFKYFAITFSFKKTK